MRDFTISDAINAAKQIVIYNSHDELCKRLNGFAIIDDQFDWDKDSIEAKAEKDFYFSRDKERMLYPALAFSFNNRGIGNFKGEKYNDYCTTVAIGIVDQKKEPCTNCDPCDQRGKEQIYIDAASLLKKVINSMAGIKLYRTVKDAVNGFLWTLPEIMQLLIDEGIYDSATISKPETSSYEMIYQNRNENLQFNDLPLTKQNTLAVWTSVTFCEFCTESEMTFTYKKYKGQECCP